MTIPNMAFKKLKPPFLIHTDLIKSLSFIRNNSRGNVNRIDFKMYHFNFISQYFGLENLILPSFNYSFAKDKIFNVQHATSDVGALSNFIINNEIMERTKTPIFSFLTNIGEILEPHDSPFSCGSVFDFLYRNDGTIVFYGADISTCTYIHYIEDQYGPPLYRYDKNFCGLVIDKGVTREAIAKFHARPIGIKLDYDWRFLFNKLVSNNVVHELGPFVFAVRCRDLSNLWGNIFADNQLKFISETTKDPLTELIESIGRRFLITDFEKKYDRT